MGVFPADSSAEPIDISLSGYSDYAPTWHTDGEAVLWASTRYGQRDHGVGGVKLMMAAFAAVYNNSSVKRRVFIAQRTRRKAQERQ